MILRGIKFGRVFNASGARNFFGDGYRQTNWLIKLFGGWAGSTLVAKTTTLGARMEPEKSLGNMRLDPKTLQSVDWHPDCIWMNYFRCITLNAVGLSGPGAEALFARAIWQYWPEPFLLSFMSVAKTKIESLAGLIAFVQLLGQYKSGFKIRFGLQINVSCPNVGLNPSELITEARSALDIAAELDIPLIVKINIEASPGAAAEIADHPACDALCIGNTVKFGNLPDKIDWKKYFGTDDPKKSPLAKYGGGGLSGPILLPLVGAWILQFREYHDANIPISACGGIFSSAEALWLMEFCGADAIELGSVAMQRPWRVPGIIRAVNRNYSYIGIHYLHKGDK